MKVRREITLCKETWMVADAMPNFSSWVRAKLREQMQKDKPDRDLMHRRCGNLVQAKWSKLDQLYWGHCTVCNEALEWR